MTVSSITTASFSISGLSSCTEYQFQVQTVCAEGVSAFSGIVTFTTTGCQVTYCASTGTSTGYEYINHVSLGTINNLSGDNGGYGNFTALSTNLVGGSNNTISLTPGFHGASYQEYWTVWIDYNHNGIFTDAGEKVVIVDGTTAVSSSFIVPMTAINGTTRMRIQMQYNIPQTNPCAFYAYGEVEDYSVVIIENSQMPAASQYDSKNENGFSLYPNPAKDNLTAEFKSDMYGEVKITIYDVNGKQMMSVENSFVEGTNNFYLNTSQLIDGLYILEVESNGNVKRQRFMISK